MLKANPGEDKALPEEFLPQFLERFEGEELAQVSYLRDSTTNANLFCRFLHQCSMICRLEQGTFL